MNTLPNLLRDQRKIDADHLKLLAVFHFVGAGLAAAGLGFILLHYAMMSHFMTNPEMWQHQQEGGPPPAEVFAAFKWFYGFCGVLVVACGIGNLLSGFYIRKRKHRTFSLVVAAVNCLHMPLGTVLGVFTFVVLLRNSVRELYDGLAGPAPLPTSSEPAQPPPLAYASSPQPDAPQGDATGGLIPYKNPHALVAYYIGFASLIPVIGFFCAIAAIWLGISGLRHRKKQPHIRGSVHAWIGIIFGSGSIAMHLLVVIMLAAAA